MQALETVSHMIGGFCLATAGLLSATGLPIPPEQTLHIAIALKALLITLSIFIIAKPVIQKASNPSLYFRPTLIAAILINLATVLCHNRVDVHHVIIQQITIILVAMVFSQMLIWTNHQTIMQAYEQNKLAPTPGESIT